MGFRWAVLGSEFPLRSGKFFILTAQEYVHRDQNVSWRMGKKRVEKMKKEG